MSFPVIYCAFAFVLGIVMFALFFFVSFASIVFIWHSLSYFGRVLLAFCGVICALLG